jgi:hypothetical protein
MSLLIPREQLEAARERYFRELAEAQSPATPAATAAPTESGFVYQPRTVAHYNARINQCSLGPGSTAEAPKKSPYASPNSRCSFCGHIYKLHCRRPRLHYTAAAETYWCNGSHCREIATEGSCNCAGFTREPVKV